MKRVLSPKLQEFLDSQILVSGETTPQQIFLDAARACIGVEEEGGDNRGPLVEAFQVTVGGANGESWCLSFIQALFAYLEACTGHMVDLPLTEHVLTLWDKSPKESKMKKGEPEPGDLVLWQYGDTRNGHIGVVMKNDYRVIHTVEGNTSPSGIVEREGNGVYEKIRAKSGTSVMQIVGYIRPKYIELL